MMGSGAADAAVQPSGGLGFLHAIAAELKPLRDATFAG